MEDVRLEPTKLLVVCVLDLLFASSVGKSKNCRARRKHACVATEKAARNARFHVAGRCFCGDFLGDTETGLRCHQTKDVLRTVSHTLALYVQRSVLIGCPRSLSFLGFCSERDVVQERGVLQENAEPGREIREKCSSEHGSHWPGHFGGLFLTWRCVSLSAHSRQCSNARASTHLGTLCSL